MPTRQLEATFPRVVEGGKSAGKGNLWWGLFVAFSDKGNQIAYIIYSFVSPLLVLCLKRPQKGPTTDYLFQHFSPLQLPWEKLPPAVVQLGGIYRDGMRERKCSWGPFTHRDTKSYVVWAALWAICLAFFFASCLALLSQCSNLHWCSLGGACWHSDGCQCSMPCCWCSAPHHWYGHCWQAFHWLLWLLQSLRHRWR